MCKLTIRAVWAAVDFSKAITAVPFSLYEIEEILWDRSSDIATYNLDVNSYCPQNLLKEEC